MISFAGLRRTAIFVVTLLAALALWAAPASAVAPPQVMAALGDSITRGYNSAGTEFTFGTCPMLRGGNPFDLDCPTNSWSTGTNPAVKSQFQRIQAIDPGRNLVAFNDAVSGARVAPDPDRPGIDLLSQAQRAARHDPDYVTIEIGANDACRPTIADQTPIGFFSGRVEAALETLVAADPKVYVQMLSIPDIYKLWELFTSPPNFDATLVRWTGCQALLANPTSMADEDVVRRAKFRAQVIAYNDALAAVCAEFKRCLFDNNAVFKSSFTADDVATVRNTAGLELPFPQPDFWDFVPVLDSLGYPGSTADYFHPSLMGQVQLAETSWNATFSMK
jgi:lysophospholipase L1-like esterase